MTPRLLVLAGDPLRTPGDALVRPVTAGFEGITPWAREAEVVGGDGLRDRLATLGTLPAGAVLVTPAGELPFQLLLHLVLLAPGEEEGPGLLLRGLRHALRQAREWEVEALVLPLLGVGPGQLDVETAAEILADALAETWEQPGSQPALQPASQPALQPASQRALEPASQWAPATLRIPVPDPAQVSIVAGILRRGLPGVAVEVSP